MAEAKRNVWPYVGAAVDELCAELEGPLIEQIAALEAGLAEAPLDRRVRRLKADEGVAIRDYADALAGDFYRINAEWIETMFALEAADREVMENPRAAILDTGGAILFAETPDLGVVGTAALRRTGETSFELIKMGVLAQARGRGIGEKLLAAAVARAGAMGAETLYLLTNRKCAAAIHLYERAGFVHDAAILAEHGARYARCDVAMRYRGARRLRTFAARAAAPARWA
jgi:N-acetylglutamate synthase-like GNAT family acetyltransferase